VVTRQVERTGATRHGHTVAQATEEIAFGHALAQPSSLGVKALQTFFDVAQQFIEHGL